MPDDERFVEVRVCDIRCQDAWPVARMRKTAMAAYRRLDQRGDIRIRYPVFVYPDCILIRYDASLPDEWIREALCRDEQALIAEATAERDWLEARLWELDAVMNESLFSVFERMAGRYGQIQRLLI